MQILKAFVFLMDMLDDIQVAEADPDNLQLVHVIRLNKRLKLSARSHHQEKQLLINL